MIWYFVSGFVGFIIALTLVAYCFRKSWNAFLDAADDNDFSPGEALDKIINKEVTFDFGDFILKSSKKDKSGLKLVN